MSTLCSITKQHQVSSSSAWCPRERRARWGKALTRLGSPRRAWHHGARHGDHRSAARRAAGAALPPATISCARSPSPGACRLGASGRRRHAPLGRRPTARRVVSSPGAGPRVARVRALCPTITRPSLIAKTHDQVNDGDGPAGHRNADRQVMAQEFRNCCAPVQMSVKTSWRGRKPSPTPLYAGKAPSLGARE